MKVAYQKIINKLGKDRVKLNESMANHTTFKIGGPADLFYEAKTEEMLVRSVRLVREMGVPYFILGNGSNLLVGDKGFRGIVIKNLVSKVKIIGRLQKPKIVKENEKVPYKAAHPKKYLKVADLDFPDGPLDTVVEVGAGVPLQALITWSLKNNLSGLHWFAGIPASVGGAVVHNAHGFTRLFANFLKSLKVLDKQGNLKEISLSEVNFGYGFSDIPQKYAVIVSVNLLLSSKNVAKAKEIYKKWQKRKLMIQPQKNCPGSIFKNISENLAKKIGAPTPGTGWLIDQCGLKGKRIGKAEISPKHANFIVNLGKAKAKDVVALITLAKKKVKEKFGVDLKEEIVRVGEF